MINELERISTLLDKALCWIDSGSAEAIAILEARNIADALVELAKHQIKADPTNS